MCVPSIHPLSLPLSILPPFFLRCDVPHFPPPSLQRWDKEQSDVVMNPDSVFSRLGHHGLISFSDYLFMLTILASEPWVLFPGLPYSVANSTQKWKTECFSGLYVNEIGGAGYKANQRFTSSVA